MASQPDQCRHSAGVSCASRRQCTGIGAKTMRPGNAGSGGSGDRNNAPHGLYFASAGAIIVVRTTVDGRVPVSNRGHHDPATGQLGDAGGTFLRWIIGQRQQLAVRLNQDIGMKTNSIGLDVLITKRSGWNPTLPRSEGAVTPAPRRVVRVSSGCSSVQLVK